MNNQTSSKIIDIVQNEDINISNIDHKFNVLKYTNSSIHINFQIPITAMILMISFISILGVKIYQQNKIIVDTIALEQLEQKRSKALNNDYIYSVLVSSYTSE